MTQVAKERARRHTIRPRTLDLQIPDDTPRYWANGDPYSTHLLNALSLTFPGGERMFMDAVRAHRDRITDPALLEQIRGFLRQEAMHSHEHGLLNRWLDQLGYPAKQIEKFVSDAIAERTQRRSPKLELANTCALEHLTAIMAEAWLENPELRAECDPALAALWTWHAIEELDHKAVAFDVFAETYDDYALRVGMMAFTTLELIIGISIHQLQLMHHDGTLKNPRTWARGLWTFWGPKGHFTGLWRAYLRYFRRDFHPFDQDDAERIARGEREIEALRAQAERPTSARSPRPALPLRPDGLPA